MFIPRKRNKHSFKIIKLHIMKKISKSLNVHKNNYIFYEHFRVRFQESSL